MQLCALQINFQHTKNFVQRAKTVLQLKLKYDQALIGLTFIVTSDFAWA
jgi:hypothetical protein